MNIKNIFAASLVMLATTASAQQTINLPKPDMQAKSMTVMEALSTRHSTREFSSTPLSNQELSNLCWAACGMSRDDNHRTAPTAMNRQEIRLFAFMKDGVYEYNAKSNTLEKKADGDHRDLLASAGSSPANGKAGFKQEFVLDAPVCLLMVIDFDIFGRTDIKAHQMGAVDAGIVCENINLYCQSAGLNTVPRATHDTDGIRTLLGFSDKQLPIMNNPVGKPQKHDMVGAYTEGHQVSNEEMTLFNETYKGKEKLTPVSVSTQVVAGTNYRFVCKNEKGKKVTVVIFKALPCNGGKAEVTSVE